MEGIGIVDMNADNILEYGVCGYKNIKRAGYPEKIEWLKDRFSEGLKIKSLYSEEDGTQVLKQAAISSFTVSLSVLNALIKGKVMVRFYWMNV